MPKGSEANAQTISETLGQQNEKEQAKSSAYWKSYEERKIRTATRISSRILKAANRGHFTTDVRGGPLGIKRTKHSIDVVEAVAEQLDERGVAIAVHRAVQPGSIYVGIGFMDTQTEFQIAKVTALDGEPVNPPYSGYERDKIFPPAELAHD